MFKLLKELTELHSPCGYEQPVAHYLKEKASAAADSVKMDGLGNVIARKKGTLPGPAVIVTAHMDEVGFIVKKIEKNGLLRFEKLGGHDDRILLAQRVSVRSENGLLRGVIGTMSAHYMKFDDPGKVRKHQQLYIDIGASSDDMARKMGVEVGTPVSWTSELELLGDESTGKVVGKALDDRAGCTVLLKLLEELDNKEFPGEVIFMFTVQEEVGLRGAKAAAESVEADVAIAIDATSVSDTPEETMDDSLKLSSGTGIKVMDFSLIAQPTVKDMLASIAHHNQIPYQLEVFPGIGTDGGAVSLSNKGIPTGVLSIPSRYAHSPVEVIDLKDLEATKALLQSFIFSLNETSSFQF